MTMLNLLNNVKPSLKTFGFVDDFDYFSIDETGSAGRWTTLDSDTGASCIHDADGLDGRVIMTTGTTDDNEAAFWTNETFTFTVGKPALVFARIQFEESDTPTPADSLRFAWGLAQPAQANLIPTGPQIPRGFIANSDVVAWFKEENTNHWNLSFSGAVDGGRYHLAIDGTAGGPLFQTMAIHIDPISSTECIYTPLMDWEGGNNLTQVYQRDISGKPSLVQTRQPYEAAEEMSLFFHLKNSSATSEVALVDLAGIQVDR